MAAEVNAPTKRLGSVSRHTGNRPFAHTSLEPLAGRRDPFTGGGLREEAQINHQWHDTMVDTPEPDGPAYFTGWTISGLAVVATIIAVWVLGI
jgi:hypothetical protein